MSWTPFTARQPLRIGALPAPDAGPVPGSQDRWTASVVRHRPERIFRRRVLSANSAEISDGSAEGGTARGHRLVSVRFYPSIRPAAGIMRYCTDMTVRVDFSGGDWAGRGVMF